MASSLRVCAYACKHVIVLLVSTLPHHAMERHDNLAIHDNTDYYYYNYYCYYYYHYYYYY